MFMVVIVVVYVVIFLCIVLYFMFICNGNIEIGVLGLCLVIFN